MENIKIKNIVVFAQMTDNKIRQIIVKEKIDQWDVLNMIQRNNKGKIDITEQTYDSINWKSDVDLSK
jgi:hypothetical protein